MAGKGRHTILFSQWSGLTVTILFTESNLREEGWKFDEKLYLGVGEDAGMDAMRKVKHSALHCGQVKNQEIIKARRK